MGLPAGPILVTGASGFVGRHLMPILRAGVPGREIVAASLDIRDPHAVLDAVRGLRPAACVHLAAIASVAEARRDPDAVWQVNLHGTLHLARALRAHAPDCLLIFASSADAYGSSFAAWPKVDETVALAPLNTYGASKAAADLALGAMAAEGLRVVRLRAFNHTGPGQADSFVVPAFARQVARIAAGLQPPTIRVGDLSAHRDFLDVRDVCAAYAACIQHANRLGRGCVLNIASGTPRRVGEVLDDLCAIAGVKAEIVLDPERMRPSDIPTACGDAALARETLGWQASTPWQRTLSDVYEDWRLQTGTEKELLS